VGISPPARSACHAEGRGFESLQPLSKRPAFAGLFRCGSRLVPLHPVGLIPESRRADRRPFQGTPPVCRTILVRPNRSPSAGLQKVRCSACCGRYPDSCCNGTILQTAPAGAIPAVAVPGGQSGSSPETARSTSARSATPASHGTQSRERLRRTASEAAARFPSPGACVAAVTPGSSPRVSLSVGKQTSARTWAGLLVVVRCGADTSAGEDFRSWLKAGGETATSRGAASRTRLAGALQAFRRLRIG
jgi:hypothetical protein